ncbi:family 10 glycosylhydrolase [Kroppenstedtia sanguinis]|uniref:Family 10 glycosylhydrolase n=1 Tax=Kroppenstedtia sanguinis TaxID=1380684 RepID=A0ABW4C9A4_9BACL
MKRWVAGLTMPGVLSLFAGGPVPVGAVEPKREFRAFWVDAFHDGFKSPEQVDQLLRDVRRSQANAVMVQVRRRGDAYFNKALEPRTEDPALQADFDALDYLLKQAHSGTPRIEVHAWLTTLPIWNSATPPQSPDHVFNRHGPGAKGRDYWLMDSYDGENRSGANYLLDPGHPDALDYTVDQYIHVAKQYPVDGIHLDLVRYMGEEWGYNPVSLERYQKQTGLEEKPHPEDARWKEWRRKQVDHLLRKVYLKSIAIRPDLKVSAAVIAWGKGPQTLAEYKQSAPYNQVMQNWDGWLSEGILDLVLPMNYDREHEEEQREWYHLWVDWEKDHQYNRQIAAGPGIYLNSISGSLSQISRAQTPSAAGNHLVGVSLYSYAETNKDEASREEFLTALTKATSHGKPVFAEPALPPKMPWKTRPQKGALMGQVLDSKGNSPDGLTLRLRQGKRIHTLLTDGNGFFGKTELSPGLYILKSDRLSSSNRLQTVRVTAGRVTEVKVQLK